MKWGIAALVVCCAVAAASANTRRLQLSVPTRRNDEGKSNMMQKQQASPKRPSPYMRTAMTNRNEKKKAAPNMRNLPQQKQGVTRLSIPRGKPQKRMQLSVPRRVPGMSEDDAQAPSMNPMAKVGPSQKGPSLRVPGGAKETMAMKDKDMPEFRLSVPAFRNGNQNKKPFRLRVPQSPEMVEKAAAAGRTGQKRRNGIQLSVPRQDVRMSQRRNQPQLRVPSLGMRRSDTGNDNAPQMKKAMPQMKVPGMRRNKRSPEEEEKDFVVEDHVVKMLDGEKAEGRSALEVEDLSEVTEAEAEDKPKSRIEKNKEAIQGRVKEVISNVVSSMERMVEEKELLEDDLKRLMALPIREEDLQDRIHAKLERIYEKLEEQAEDRAKLTEYMDDEIQWDDELSRRMDEELDAYEMERIRSEVEWRREQQKADKLIRANFDAESQVEEEEKSLLSMLEERIRELNELKNNPMRRYDNEDY